MTPSPDRSHSTRHPAIRDIGAVLQVWVALLIAVTLPAQAFSASVERVWNAAHVHRGMTTSPSTQKASNLFIRDTLASLRRGGTDAQRNSAERVRDIAKGLRGAEIVQIGLDAETRRLDAHAESHRAGIPHHHDPSAPGVVYVDADDSDPPISATQRIGKHDHDGFSPAVLVAPTLTAPCHCGDVLALAPAPRAAPPGTPGERPPR